MMEQRSSWMLRFIGILFSFKVAASAVYHLDMTIVNRYGKDVRIITTHPNTTYQRFMIPVAQSYQITSTFSTRQRIVITAYEAATFIPIMVNGMNSVFVFPNLERVAEIYYVPSAPKYNSTTPGPVVGSSDATSTQTLTDATVPSQGQTDAVTTGSTTDAGVSTEDPVDAVVSTKMPTDAAVSTEVVTDGSTNKQSGNNKTTTQIYFKNTTTNTGVSTEYATGKDVSTEGLTTTISTQGSTDTEKTLGTTDASVPTMLSTKDQPTKGLSTTGGAPSDAIPTNYLTALSTTDAPATTVSRRDPTNTGRAKGPTDRINFDKDAEDSCENDKKFLYGFIILAILLVVLLVITACLVYRLLKSKHGNSGILYVTPAEKSNDCEAISCEPAENNATYTTFKKNANGQNDKLINESETGF